MCRKNKYAICAQGLVLRVLSLSPVGGVAGQGKFNH